MLIKETNLPLGDKWIVAYTINQEASSYETDWPLKAEFVLVKLLMFTFLSQCLLLSQICLLSRLGCLLYEWILQIMNHKKFGGQIQTRMINATNMQWNDMHNIQITKLGAMLQEEGRLFNYNSLPSTLPFYLLTCIT